MTIEEKFPPLYYARLRVLKWRAVKVLGFVWALSIGVLIADVAWPIGATRLACLLWAVALWLSWAFWLGLRGAKRSRVVPYFRKGTARVHSGTFASGEFLARHWSDVERAAHALEVEPLSRFGLEDENEVRPFEWHDAARGLASVAALAHCSQVSAEVQLELALFEAALRDAREKDVPFRLLLKGYHGMSGVEADAREGHF